MSDMREQVREVLEAHPLVAGDGEVLCHGCHWVLGDPGRHLFEALLKVLEPQPTAEPVVERPKPDYRESQIEWRAS